MAGAPDKTDSKQRKDVRNRLLEAAEVLFAERGFDGTSVRDLAARAGCNVASVNYYFGGKENLYRQLWHRHLHELTRARIASIEAVMSGGQGPCVEDLLRSFSHAFVGPLMDDECGRRLMRLMAREMIDPHLPAEMFGKEVIRPTMGAMQGALEKLCPQLDKSKVPAVVFSLVGQLVHAIRLRVMRECMEDELLEIFEPEKLTEHIVAFTAAGIRAYTRESAQ